LSRLLYRTVALAAALLAAARTVNAETVALGSFAHVDLERNDPDTGASIATLLQAALGETPGRTFVERQEAQKLMDELGLAALGESDPESASRIGKLLRADVMLTGTFVTPEGGKPFIVLETTELARAEPLGQARVELDRVLERGRLAVPGRDDMAKIAAAAGALLDESRDRLAASRGLVSIKFLGFTHNLRDPRVGSFEAQLAAAIDSAAAASGTHRVLSLERADVATQESEFVLLGLAEADAKAYAQVDAPAVRAGASRRGRRRSGPDAFDQSLGRAPSSGRIPRAAGPRRAPRLRREARREGHCRRGSGEGRRDLRPGVRQGDRPHLRRA
jgi:hypothetical protein